MYGLESACQQDLLGGTCIIWPWPLVPWQRLLVLRCPALDGCCLVQSLVKHKSRLEREKEAAEQQRKAEEAAQAQAAKRKVVHTPGSRTKQVPCSPS